MGSAGRVGQVGPAGPEAGGEPRGASPSLPRAELLWYALGSLPGGVGSMGWTFLLFYYNQVLGLSGSAVGALAAVIAVFDALTDPPAGALSDRTRSRLGRRHPYLFAMAVPAALTFALVWAPPGALEGGGLLAFLVAAHLLNRLFSTFYTVPYLALGAEIADDYQERTRIATERSIWFHGGRALAGAALLLLFLRPTAEFPNGQLNPAGYPRFGLSFSLLIAVTLWASAWKTRHWAGRLSLPAEDAPGGTWRFVRDLREALATRSCRAVVLSSISRHIAWGVSDVLGLYLATYFWKVETGSLFLFGVGMFAGTFTGLPLWRDLSRRLEKRTLCLLGDAGYLGFLGVPLLLKSGGWWVPEAHPLYLPAYIATGGFLAHFFIAAPGALLGSMLGDVTDLDELESGRRREGVIFGAESFSWKVLTGLGPLLGGFVVDFAGLTDELSPETAPDSVGVTLALTQGAVMACFFVLSMLFVLRYDLDRGRHRSVLEALGRRREEPG